MNVSADVDIRGRLTGLLLGTRSLSEFSRWVGETVDRAEIDADVETWDLYLAVENVLAEWSGTHITSKDVTEALRLLSAATVAADLVPTRLRTKIIHGDPARSLQ